MRCIIQKIIFLFSIVISLFCPTVVFAEKSEDVYISVSSNRDTSDDVKSGDDIVFTITVKNTSEDDKTVKLKCKQNKWSKEVDVSAGSVKDVRMNYTVPDDVDGGDSLKFEFSGMCDDMNVAEDGDTYFSFYVEKIEDLRFKVQLKQDKEFSIGDILKFEILVENVGNTDIDSIEIEHSLGDEKIEINSLSAGKEKTVFLEYQVLNTIPLNEVLVDTFYLNADGISEMTKDITFSVLAEDEIELYSYITPEVYDVNDRVSAILSIQNVGSTSCENLIITNSKERSWQERIDYLAAGGTAKSEFSFEVLQEETISFYVRNQDGKLLSEQDIKIYPVERKDNSSNYVPEPDTDFPDSSLTPIDDNTPVSGGGSISIDFGNIEDDYNFEIDSVPIEEVENKEFEDSTSNFVENNKTTNNSASSNNNVSNSGTIDKSQDTYSSENEVDLPKTGEYKFYKFGAFLFLFLGICYLKVRYLHI